MLAKVLSEKNSNEFAQVSEHYVSRLQKSCGDQKTVPVDRMTDRLVNNISLSKTC